MYDAIAYPGAWMDAATGLKVSTSTPIQSAARAMLARKGGATILVSGAHGALSVGDDPAKSSTIALPGVADIGTVCLVGEDVDAEIGSIQFWRKGGSPGRFELHDLRVRASNLSKFCLLVSQHLDFPRLDLHVENVTFAQWSSAILTQASSVTRAVARVVTGDGPVGGGALWGARVQGRVRSAKLKRVTSDGFGEWGLLYIDDFEYFVEVLGCVCADAGRGAVQIASRQFEDKAQAVPTGLAQTPWPAYVRIAGNALLDCSSYKDSSAKGGWVANGSAITSAGMPCTQVEIMGNRILQSHPGGGGISVWHDSPKVGDHLTPVGKRAHGSVKCIDNELHILAGAAAGREAAQFGGIEHLELGGNTLTGTEKRVALNHTGPIDSTVGTFTGALP